MSSISIKICLDPGAVLDLVRLGEEYLLLAFFHALLFFVYFILWLWLWGFVFCW